MIPYRLWDREFKDLPPDIQKKLHLPSGDDFYNSLSVKDKKELLRVECGYDPEEDTEE